MYLILEPGAQSSSDGRNTRWAIGAEKLRTGNELVVCGGWQLLSTKNRLSTLFSSSQTLVWGNILRTIDPENNPKKLVTHKRAG